MKSMAMSFFAATAALFLVSSAAGQEGPYPSIVYGNDLFLKGEPVVTEFKGAKAVVEFETVNPVSPALIYFGTALPTQKLGAAYYRKEAKEKPLKKKTFFTSHRVKLNIAKLEKTLYDSVGLIEKGGGTIYCRITAYDPSVQHSRFHDFRFRYRRQGPVKSGNYTLTCALIEGPMVDCVTPSSAVISWKTDRESPGRAVIEGGQTISSPAARIHEVPLTGLKPDTRYSYRVDYSEDRGTSTAFSFRTAPEPGSRKPFSFGFMSDSRVGVGGGENAINGVNTKILAQFTAALYNHGARFICFGGDLVNGYTSERYNFDMQLAAFKRAVGPVGASLPIYEAMGNHEMIGDFFQYPDSRSEGDHFLVGTDRRGKESAEAIFAGHVVNPKGSIYGFSARPEKRLEGTGGTPVGPAYDETVYSFNYGNAHFTILNTNYWTTMIKGAPGTTGKYANKRQNAEALKVFGGTREGYIRDNQIEWFKRDLSAAEADEDIDWIFVIFHEPPYPCGGHLSDVMYWGYNGQGDRDGLNDHSQPCGDVLDMRDRVMETVCGYEKVVAVMCGDEHNYSRTLIDSGLNSRYRYPVWQIISGGVGAPYYSQDKSASWTSNVAAFTAARNYCLFSVDGDSVRLFVFGEDGRIIEHVRDLTKIKR